MTSRDFCYWLQGFFELTRSAISEAPASLVLTPVQADMIERHLALVFKHEIDPSAGGPEHQAALNQIHQALKPEPQKPTPQIGGTGPGGAVYRC